MNLNAVQREKIRMKYGGRCAYCGTPLTKKWHVDHVKAVGRISYYDHSLRAHVPTGASRHPEHDHIDNLSPSCIPCNVDKSDSSLNSWRKRLEDSAARLHRNYSTYRHAKRFNLITEADPVVVFWFERYRIRTPLPKELTCTELCMTGCTLTDQTESPD